MYVSIEGTASDLYKFLLGRVHRQQGMAKSKKRSRAESESVQESGRKKKRVKELCEENTTSPLAAKKNKKLNTSRRKCKSVSRMSDQVLDIVPTLRGNNEGVPHQIEKSVEQLNTDQRQTCNGKHLTLDKRPDASPTGRTN